MIWVLYAAGVAFTIATAGSLYLAWRANDRRRELIAQGARGLATTLGAVIIRRLTEALCSGLMAALLFWAYLEIGGLRAA